MRFLGARVGPLAVVVAGALTSGMLLAQGHDKVIGYVPPPENNSKLSDPVTELARRIEAGQEKLSIDPVTGTLPSLLRALDIPVSSQVLVFSKTSLQHEFISPRNPRAIYFNDDIYVGFVPDGSVIEISTVDPDVGAVFYTIGRRLATRPVLAQGVRCLQCHQIPATLGVSGHLMRSVFVRSDGSAASGERSYLTDDRSPFEERWGGWFVSGTVTNALHMGNATLPAGERSATFDRGRGTAITDVGPLFNHTRYLSPQSDVVALMVLGHQVRMHNLIARLRYTVSDAAPSDPQAGTPVVLPSVAEQIEELLRDLLFIDAAPLNGAVTGPTTFSADFSRRGPTDAKGRSLRQFDLTSRLFTYPCSYLIYSDAFLGLPDATKAELYRRLWLILAGRDETPAFARLVPADRLAVLEILAATHPEFAAAKPGWWGV